MDPDLSVAGSSPLARPCPVRMYPTTEVRWFLLGPIPAEAEAWFATLGAPVEPAARTDRYLVPSGENEPGIKLREGRIEVKARTGIHGPAEFAESIGGVVESYRKWSFPLAGDSERPGAGWIDVAKSRRLRTFTVESGRAEEVRLRPETGCDLELGEADAGEKTWWTVCLEAFGGDADARRATLLATAKLVFGSPSPRLPDARSMGYVERLAGADPESWA